LTARKTPKRQPRIHMMVVPITEPDTEVIGFHLVPDRLPAVHRLPGETVAQLIHRALALATGAGPFLAHLRTKGQTHADT
jgi:hypothetical protein